MLINRTNEAIKIVTKNSTLALVFEVPQVDIRTFKNALKMYILNRK